MQLLKTMREQLGKTSTGRSVDAVAAANSLGMDRGALDFHRSLHDLVRADYLEEPTKKVTLRPRSTCAAATRAMDRSRPTLPRSCPRPRGGCQCSLSFCAYRWELIPLTLLDRGCRYRWFG